jgi:hypothetical protein
MSARELREEVEKAAKNGLRNIGSSLLTQFNYVTGRAGVARYTGENAPDGKF